MAAFPPLDPPSTPAAPPSAPPRHRERTPPPRPAPALATTWQPAPLWRRSLAALLDLVPPLALWALVTWVLVATNAELDLPPWNLFDQVVEYLHERPGRAALSALALVLFEVLWPVLFAARTPGRRALGVALLGADGRPLDRMATLAWSLWRIPSLALAGVGAWWAIVNPERRTLHDRLARAWLVRVTATTPRTLG